MPASAFISVDLPLPLPPTRALTSPERTSSPQPESTQGHRAS